MVERARRRRRADKKAYALDRMNRAIERLGGLSGQGALATLGWIVRWGLVSGARPAAGMKLRDRR